MLEPDLADLDLFFKPGSVAIVGVARGDYRIGGLSYLLRYQEGGFPGPIYPINPKASEIRGLRAYPNLSALPVVPDLAVICLGADRVADVLEECGRVGVKHIHIFSAGFKELNTEEGRRRESRISEIAGRYGLLVIGPNCMGPYCPASGLTPWGAIPGLDGRLGIISQSGGITQRLTEYTCSLGVGVAKAVSFGNAAVLDSLDFLEYMARDPRIQVIAMYLESVRDGRVLLDLARQVNREKPIIMIKGGETEAGAKTVASHTGSMAGEHRIWEACFRQSGLTQVHSLDAWYDAVLAFLHLPAATGKGVFLIGGGGGNSVSYGDSCVRQGLDVPRLSAPIMDWLRRHVPEAGTISGNPLDVWTALTDASFVIQLLELAYQDPAVHMIIVDRVIPRKAFHMPGTPDSNPAVIEFVKKEGHRKPTVFAVESDGGDPELAAQGAGLRAEYCRNGIPAYPSVERAARALLHLYRYHAQSG